VALVGARGNGRRSAVLQNLASVLPADSKNKQGDTPMKIEIPEAKKLVYEMRFPVRWGDMDAMGHVNNTVYFRYMETARIEWLTSVGCTPDPQGQGPVIVNAFCNFYQQLEYPNEVVLKFYVSDPARTTFETWATMERVDRPGVICAAGGGTTIWVDLPLQKAASLPDWMRELVTA
jgi:acyl-CoA thioester hydrolase